MGGSAHAQPRRRDPAKRRQEILEAAAEIVVDSGAGALTHRSVATRAKMPLGTLTRHFPSIDELRSATLQGLSDDIDRALDHIDHQLDNCDEFASCCADLVHDYLLDMRQVQATLAITNAATSDESARALALHWADRLTDVLAKHVGQERATAIVVYVDGALVHAALHDVPLGRDQLAPVIEAIATMPRCEADKVV